MPEQNVTFLPLEGRHILVTRTREQASTLSEKLKTLGAIPVEFPTIRIVSPQNWEILDSTLGKLFLAGAAMQNDRATTRGHTYYKWLIFTSVNGVSIFCERLLELGFHTEHMPVVRVAAIGPATASALARYGISADLVPGEYTGEGVASALIEDARQRGESLKGKRVLLPRAAEARKVLVTELEEAGAIVDEVAAYHTASVTSDDDQGHDVLSMLQEGKLDIITFTSSSTVRNFMEWLRSCVVGATELLTRSARLKIACIGPITSQTARELGLDVHIEAQEFTIDGLVEAIVQSEGT